MAWSSTAHAARTRRRCSGFRQCASGSLMPSASRSRVTSRIFQLSRSTGGVPKLAVREAHVSMLGLDGDGHDHPKIHGGPERALCLYSLEVIAQLQAEGHPI